MVGFETPLLFPEELGAAEGVANLAGIALGVGGEKGEHAEVEHHPGELGFLGGRVGHDLGQTAAEGAASLGIKPQLAQELGLGSVKGGIDEGFGGLEGEAAQGRPAEPDKGRPYRRGGVELFRAGAGGCRQNPGTQPAVLEDDFPEFLRGAGQILASAEQLQDDMGRR